MWEQLQTPRCSSGGGDETRLPPRAREENFWTEKHCTGKRFHEVPLFISATFVLIQTHKDTISSWGLTACKDRPELGNLSFILPCFMSKEGFLFFLLSKDTWTLSDLLTFIKILILRGRSQHPLSSWEKPSKHILMIPHHYTRVLQAMLRQEAQQPFTGLVFIRAMNGACRCGPIEPAFMNLFQLEHPLLNNLSLLTLKCLFLLKKNSSDTAEGRILLLHNYLSLKDVAVSSARAATKKTTRLGFMMLRRAN